MDGPLQRDEALFLHALVRVLRPRIILKIGFLRGHTAFNFLAALDDDARLYSVDVDPASASHAAERFRHERRLHLRIGSQVDAIVAIYDRGSVPRHLLEAIDHWALTVPELWVDNKCEVQPGERAFVNRL